MAARAAVATVSTESAIQSQIGHTHELGKTVSLGTEAWVQQQQTTQRVLGTHGDDISAMKHNIKNLEQQVKAIARVMTQQNVPHLEDTLRQGLQGLRKELETQINEKHQSLAGVLEKEVMQLSNKKGGIYKRMDDLEGALMGKFQFKFEEQAKLRAELEQRMDANEEQIRCLPLNLNTNLEKAVRMLDGKVDAVAQKFKEFESNNEDLNRQQDEALRKQEEDIRKQRDINQAMFGDESDRLQKICRKIESQSEDKVRMLRDALNAEQRDRVDMCKAILNQVTEKLASVKRDVERAFHLHETDLEGQVRSVATSITEIKKGVEAEKVQREAADTEIMQGLTQEKKERDTDDERLLVMIQSCMATLAKMHKGGIVQP